MINREHALTFTPNNVLRIRTIDAHTGGEPLRVFISGWPQSDASTILGKRQNARENLDQLRKALMWEPRGHADMYGCVITEPERADSDFGVLFLHNEGFSTMCGHGIIAVAKVALETGIIPIEEPHTDLRIDAPAGLIRARAIVENSKVTSVSFYNVPSYVVSLDNYVQVEGFGSVRYDIAFGGAFYAYVDAPSLGLDLGPESSSALIHAGKQIKKAVIDSHPLSHPESDDLAFLYGVIFTGPAKEPGAHSRNVCIFADGEVDRSPTGTGVSGRAALHYKRGEIELGQAIVIESIIGSRFEVSAFEETRFGEYDAIVPLVKGRAFMTGSHEFWLDPDDPYQHGFILR